MAEKGQKPNSKQHDQAPEAKPAWDAFERGDNKSARKLAQALLAGNPSDAARRDANDILSRTGLEVSIKLTLLGMAVVLAAIIALLLAR